MRNLRERYVFSAIGKLQGKESEERSAEDIEPANSRPSANRSLAWPRPEHPPEDLDDLRVRHPVERIGSLSSQIPLARQDDVGMDGRKVIRK